MDRHTLYWKALGRGNILENWIHSYFSKRMSVKMSRVNAKMWRVQHIKTRGYSVINRYLFKEIKRYSKSRFGCESYWPWLALYTEVRGEFIEGWVPDDYYRFKIINELNMDTFSRLSVIKSFDYRLFNSRVVEPVAICHRNCLYEIDGRSITRDHLIDKLKEMDCEFIVKPDGGSGGKNIYFIHSNDVTIKHIPTDGSAIIQKVVTQHFLLDRVNPSSVNTFRVLSHINKDGKVDLKFVILRFGVAGSRLDNISRGGGWVFINSNGKAEQCSYNLEGFEMYDTHPDTNVDFSTLSFPFYDKIIELCIKAHQMMPYVGLIGWDVFINTDGLPKLIEWNARNPFFWPVEARYGPFLNNI